MVRFKEGWRVIKWFNLRKIGEWINGLILGWLESN